MPETEPEGVEHGDWTECEECEEPVRFDEPAAYYKTADDRFWHAECAPGAERDKWDESWSGICEMPSGAISGFDEFVDKVEKKMAETGNEVGRPLVMKVTVQVADGGFRRPEVDDDDE